MVHLLPCGTRVKKAVTIWITDEFKLKNQANQLRKEIAVYKHLPDVHPRLLRMYESADDGKFGVSLTLEYLPNNTLQEHLRGFTFQEGWNAKCLPGESYHPKEHRHDKEDRLRRRHDSIPLRQRARWALEATDGIAVLHAHDVIHCDIKPENMGLDAQLGVRIFDLAGSSLPGQPPLCAESGRYYMPRSSWEVYNVTTDLFALGSSIYHIVTGIRPYDKVPNDNVDALYQQGKFPNLSTNGTEGTATATGGSKAKDDTNGTSPVTGQLLFAETIRRCWHGEFATATAVLESLKAEAVRTFDDTDIKYIEEASGIMLK